MLGPSFLEEAGVGGWWADRRRGTEAKLGNQMVSGCRPDSASLAV